jgi:hypothetical protein
MESPKNKGRIQSKPLSIVLNFQQACSLYMRRISFDTNNILRCCYVLKGCRLQFAGFDSVLFERLKKTCWSEKKVSSNSE